MDIPKFVDLNYIELSKISNISRFRSGIGHDYSTGNETCRSMKHYFVPSASLDWSGIKIYSPVNGTVIDYKDEGRGFQVQIIPHEYPNLLVIIFHINTQIPIQIGANLTAGQQLGTHIGSQTYSDIAIMQQYSTSQGLKTRYISYFEIMTDVLFSQYSLRGVSALSTMIISEQERNAYPLSCQPDGLFNDNTSGISDWVNLT
jgi:hypothetical protein